MTYPCQTEVCLSSLLVDSLPRTSPDMVPIFLFLFLFTSSFLVSFVNFKLCGRALKIRILCYWFFAKLFCHQFPSLVLLIAVILNTLKQTYVNWNKILLTIIMLIFRILKTTVTKITIGIIFKIAYKLDCRSVMKIDLFRLLFKTIMILIFIYHRIMLMVQDLILNNKCYE